MKVWIITKKGAATAWSPQVYGVYSSKSIADNRVMEAKQDDKDENKGEHTYETLEKEMDE